MATLELIGADGETVADAVIDPTVEPLPRALITSRPDASPTSVADAVVDGLRGHRLSTREGDVADALVARGAELVRASALMVLGLPAQVSPTDVDVRPLRDAAAEYGEIVWRAYPPDHPDHDLMDATPAEAAKTVEGYLSGRIVGPLMRDASSESWTTDGELGGLCVVSEMPGDDEFEGSPWITDVCVLPSAQGQGLGRAMLGHAIRRLSEAGHPTLGLAVTQGSPARKLYEAVGFVERFPAWTLNLT
jgi:GNAT superfamily N-acetyltransferase